MQGKGVRVSKRVSEEALTAQQRLDISRLSPLEVPRRLCVIVAWLVPGGQVGDVDISTAWRWISCPAAGRGLSVTPVHASSRQAFAMHGFFKYACDFLRESAVLGRSAPA
jgi:hypothetical protein